MIDRITDYLARVADLRRQGTLAAMPFEQWLLDNGEPFGPNHPVPVGLTAFQVMRECYANSARVLMTGRLDRDVWIYAEGYAVRHSLGIPLPHAWLVHRETKAVLDLTWAEGDASYFGIPYSYEAMIDQMFTREIYGLHFDEVRENEALMAMDPKDYRAWNKW